MSHIFAHIQYLKIFISTERNNLKLKHVLFIIFQFLLKFNNSGTVTVLHSVDRLFEKLAERHRLSKTMEFKPVWINMSHVEEEAIK